MDTPARIAAFSWLKSQSLIYGDVFPRKLLQDGFSYNGKRVPLLGPQGIFKPQIFPQIPLSITTTSNSPYQDSAPSEGSLIYKFRGTDPFHRDNVGLRMAMAQKIPLIYFYSLIPSKYFAMWPVYIIGEDKNDLSFRVAVDDMKFLYNFTEQILPLAINEPEEIYRRSYITTTVKVRLHQKSFRERVLNAYQSTCALCRIKHQELLDAAHIIPDGEYGGDPSIDNGIALCKIHHSAFDNYFFGIRPDYTIEIRKELLEEDDGPMLELGFKGLHNSKIIIPRKKEHHPSTDKLEIRYNQFREAI
jgi:putative restriction endonuclease